MSEHKTLTLCVLACLTATGIGWGQVNASELTVERRALGKTPVGMMGDYLAPGSSMGDIAVAEDGSHVATLSLSGSRFVVTMDGVAGREYDQIGHFEGPDQRIGAAMILSRDGRRVAYLARRDNKDYLVVDGNEIEIRPLSIDKGGTFQFSADGSHYAMIVKGQHDSNYASWVVLDGTVSPVYTAVPELTFSPDGKRYAYIAETRTGTIVIVDGKASAGYEKAQQLVFSADSRRLAYAAKSARGWQLVLDGAPQPLIHSEDIRMVQISQDGQHVAYVGVNTADDPVNFRSDHAYLAVVDGKPSKPHPNILDLKLSPDGKRHAFIAAVLPPNGSVRFVAVVDGKESPPYDELQDITFSPDSGKVAILAQNRPNGFLLLNGQELSGAQVLRGGAVYKAGQRGGAFAYRLWGDDNYARVFWNGQQGPPLADVNLDQSAFSPDGAQLVYIAQDQNRQKVVVRNNAEMVPFPFELGRFGSKTNMFEAIQLSPDGKHYALVGDKYGTRDRYVYLDNLQGPSCFFTSMPTFSDDGNHFAFACGSGGTNPLWTIYVDGKPGPTVKEVIEHMPGSWRFVKEGKLQALVIADQQIQLLTITPPATGLAAYGSAPAPAQLGNPVSAAPQAPTPGQPPKPTNPVDSLREKLKKKLPGIFR